MVIPSHESRASSTRSHRGRHKGADADDNFTRGFSALGDLAVDGVQVSARATDLATGRVLFSVDDHVVDADGQHRQGAAADRGRRAPHGPDLRDGCTILDRDRATAVGDSGIWQHLQAPSLPVADLAALVGATSDNLATNVLLRRVGLDAVRARTESLGLTRTALLDLVRDHRGPDDAPQLSVGSARELTWLFATLARGEIVSTRSSQRVIGWLSLNTDLSMVASAFGLDPLSHRAARPRHPARQQDRHRRRRARRGRRAARPARRRRLRGRRCSSTTPTSQARLAVLDGMRTVGLDLLEYVH